MTAAQVYVGVRVLIAATRFKRSDYVAMVDEVRPELRSLERVVWLDSEEWDELLAAADGVAEDALERRSESLTPDDPIEIAPDSSLSAQRFYRIRLQP